jgi:hypothetical protein
MSSPEMFELPRREAEEIDVPRGLSVDPPPEDPAEDCVQTVLPPRGSAVSEQWAGDYSPGAGAHFY